MIKYVNATFPGPRLQLLFNCPTLNKIKSLQVLALSLKGGITCPEWSSEKTKRSHPVTSRRKPCPSMFSGSFIMLGPNKSSSWGFLALEPSNQQKWFYYNASFLKWASPFTGTPPETKKWYAQRSDTWLSTHRGQLQCCMGWQHENAMPGAVIMFVSHMNRTIPSAVVRAYPCKNYIEIPAYYVQRT